MFLSLSRLIYIWDDLVTTLDPIWAKRLFKALTLAGWIGLGVFAVWVVVPGVGALTKASKVYETEKKLWAETNSLASEIRQKMRKYLEIKDTVNNYLTLKTPYVNGKVFDTLVSLFHKIGVYDVFLKIGHPYEQEVNRVKFLMVPVQIKAYIEYEKLDDFFAVLGDTVVYRLRRLEVHWSDRIGKEKVMLDMEVIFRYRPYSREGLGV